MFEDTASVDVAYKDHRRIGHLGNRHVDQFAILEVYLGWTACPFGDHEITSCPEPCKAVLNDPDQPGSSRTVLAEPHPSPYFPSHDHLRSEVGLGFEENGVQVRVLTSG